ncbi:RagB/SusD family nutrient uptake outer membrane protein [Hymenobacter metallilatus]|uniref:RagB/SusD family nutrient uptake outer membrane protein n=1 Tax=Hymenobacter metallilatus TaxID=2493666 RepID=UPI00163A54FD
MDSTDGLQTRQDAEAALRGCYDALQSANYLGLRYQLFADLGSDNARHTGTFPTFAQIAQNQILPDNTELSAMWNAIYSGINRCNYVIEQVQKIDDPAFNKASVTAEAQALRAFNYMNLLGYWGGTPAGYGYPDGLGVPLRLEATTSINGEQIKPKARATEAEVNAAIRADLTAAAANIAAQGTKARLSKGAILALRARFELRLRNYADAADFAAQAIAALPAVTLEGEYNNIFAQKFSNESIWELPFDAVDSNSLAFFWFPAANGGRNEVDPATGLGPAHEAGDKRLNVNVVTAATAQLPSYPSGTTRKYFRVAAGDDQPILMRLGEVILTRAEALAQTGNLATALTLVNQIRTRAGLPVLATTLTQAQLITAILRERRIELANEGIRWFDLRRTNTVQATLPAVTQTFRNLWPIPIREIQTTSNLVVQNPSY